jgi:hypothetical protein
MRNSKCTTAIKNVLAEANALMGYELELVPDRPDHEYPIRGQAPNRLGYRFHLTNDPDNRKMSLVVVLAVDDKPFVQLPDGTPTLSSDAKDRLFPAIDSCFSAGNSEKHTYIELF